MADSRTRAGNTQNEPEAPGGARKLPKQTKTADWWEDVTGANSKNSQ